MLPFKNEASNSAHCAGLYSTYMGLISKFQERGDKVNNLRRNTITTLEVAEMMEVQHKDIFRVIISFPPVMLIPVVKKISATKSQSSAAISWLTSPLEKRASCLLPGMSGAFMRWSIRSEWFH